MSKLSMKLLVSVISRVAVGHLRMRRDYGCSEMCDSASPRMKVISEDPDLESIVDRVVRRSF
jgi:hypothetical protein